MLGVKILPKIASTWNRIKFSLQPRNGHRSLASEVVPSATQRNPSKIYRLSIYQRGTSKVVDPNNPDTMNASYMNLFLDTPTKRKEK